MEVSDKVYGGLFTFLDLRAEAPRGIVERSWLVIPIVHSNGSLNSKPVRSFCCHP